GTVSQNGSGATLGVQRNATGEYTQVLCDTGGISQGLELTFVRQVCGPPTPTPSGTPSTPIPTATFPACNSYTATPTSTVCPMQFTDVPPSNPFYPFVRCLACRHIVSGYSDDTFRPGDSVTRGQVAKIVSNSAGF